MGLSTYIMVMFGISLALFLADPVHLSPPLFQMMQCNDATNLESCGTFTTNFSLGILQFILDGIKSPAFLFSVGLAIFAPFITGGNFSVLYVIPILILFALANFLLLPSQFIFGLAGLPLIIKLVIVGFLNLWLLLVVVEFIRGGE